MTQSNNPLDWNLDEPTDKAQLEQRQQSQYEEDVHFLQAFSTPSGLKVLEWMERNVTNPLSWKPMENILKSVVTGYWLDAQKSLVNQIKAKIQNAKTYEEQANVRQQSGARQ